MFESWRHSRRKESHLHAAQDFKMLTSAAPHNHWGLDSSEEITASSSLTPTSQSANLEFMNKLPFMIASQSKLQMNGFSCRRMHFPAEQKNIFLGDMAGNLRKLQEGFKAQESKTLANNFHKQFGACLRAPALTTQIFVEESVVLVECENRERGNRVFWRVPNPPGANPLVAERAPWRSSQSCVTGSQQPIGNPYRFLSFLLHTRQPCATLILTRREGSFRYQGVSTRGVRHSPGFSNRAVVEAIFEVPKCL